MITQFQADLWIADFDAQWAGLLETVTDGEAGTVGETAYTGYAREQMSLAVAADRLGGRTRKNDVAVTFGENTGSAVSFIAVGAFDAVSAGNLMGILYLDGDDPVIVTAEATGDLFTGVLHGRANDDRVRLMRSGASDLPTGVTENATYWVVGVSGNTFQLSLTQGGAAITLTADGACWIMPLTPLNAPTNNSPQFAINQLEWGAGTH